MRKAMRWSLLAVAATLVAVFAVLRGQTLAWDLRNYHLYGAWAWLHDRAAIDLAPAQVQTWFNPLLNVPYFLATTAFPAWACALLLGLAQGANIFPLHAIARQLSPARDLGFARVAVPLAAAVGFLSATNISELGSTGGDNLVSLPCLASLWLLLRGFAADRRNDLATLAGAGLLAGAAAGLKLTVAPFALGLLAIVPCLPGSSWMRVRALLVFGVALLAGLLVAGGSWYERSWESYGNPFYPYFGQLFGGAWNPPFDVSDARWPPHGVGAALARPLDLIANWRATGELKFRDARLPLLLFVALSWPWWRRRVPDPDARRKLDAVTVAFVVAWCSWLLVFGYHRYLCAWEMLAPVVAMAALVAVGARPAICVSLALVLLVTTDPANLPRAAFAGRAVDVALPPIAAEADGLVLLAGDAPTAYLAIALGARNSYVRISGNLFGDPLPPYELDREAARRIDAHAGTVLALVQERDPARLQPAFARFGLELGAADCQPIASNLTEPLDVAPTLCPVQRLEPATRALARVMNHTR